MQRISKEAFEEWKKENVVTLTVFKYLLYQANIRRHLIGSGTVIDKNKSMQDIGEQTFRFLTEASIYESIVNNLEYEEIIEDEDNSFRGENFNQA